ncbi:hypothetical protein [Rhodopseudomonas sp. P2A-2r]|uniref:hypothetical protein n=1 Tax=unclassified Rhodopseudomonas TaxID=2638247 RepID=UPI002234991C|nr:hypothetical protein [Rhodopseudomonas sp. P2A-2r]UZE52422.1 hypothetical protein ONR75_09300 [Rhodopseudomonas sp. P2A-2r]
MIGRTNVSEAAIRFAIADNICFIDELPEPKPAAYPEYKRSIQTTPASSILSRAAASRPSDKMSEAPHSADIDEKVNRDIRITGAKW